MGKKKLLIYVSIGFLVVLLSGCSNKEEKKNTSLPTATTVINTPTLIDEKTSVPVYSLVPSKTPDLLQPNEFYAKDLKIGDEVVGLTVQSVERDTFEPGSLVVHFKGTMMLKGTYHYYSDEQLGQENYQLYLTIEHKSIPCYPRVKLDNMDYEERIGIINSDAFEASLGERGTSGTMEGRFSNFILVYAPHKPAEGSIQLDEIISITKQ